MKRFITILAFLCCMTMGVVAAPSTITLKKTAKGNMGSQTGNFAPVDIPVEVTYDRALHALEIKGDDEWVENVVITNDQGFVVRTSDHIPLLYTTNPSTTRFVNVVITSEEWILTATIYV